MIRLAKAEDAPQIVRLIRDFGYPALKDEIEKAIARYSSDNDSWAYVAEVEGDIIGAMSVNVTPYFHREGSILRITFIYIDPSFRRRGIGNAFIDAAKDKAVEMGCDTLELTSGNHRAYEAHLFYKQSGFTEYDGKRFILRNPG